MSTVSENGVTRQATAEEEQQIAARHTAAELLQQAKQARRESIKSDALSRIQATLPGINSFDTLDLVRNLYLSIAPAARSATADLQAAINVYTAAATAIASVNAATTPAEVAAVVVTWP